VTPDGLRFLMMKESSAGDRSHPASMVVVLNWLEELKRRIPITVVGPAIGLAVCEMG
jgi:hypothetical protein